MSPEPYSPHNFDQRFQKSLPITSIYIYVDTRDPEFFISPHEFLFYFNIYIFFHSGYLPHKFADECKKKNYFCCKITKLGNNTIFCKKRWISCLKYFDESEYFFKTEISILYFSNFSLTVKEKLLTCHLCRKKTVEKKWVN